MCTGVGTGLGEGHAMMTAGARQTGRPGAGVGHGGGTTHGVGQPEGTAPFAVYGQTVGYGDGIGHPTI